MICLAAETPFSGIFASGVEDAAGSAKSTPVQGLGAIASKPAGSTLIHLYSVSAITDAAGSVVERYGYDAYGDSVVTDASGTPLAGNESSVGQPYRFTGRRLDGETGLSYFRARYMDHGLGRFIGRDQMISSFVSDIKPSPGDGYHDGMGLYRGYFIPNFTDPSGHKCEDEKQALDDALAALDRADRQPGPSGTSRLLRQRYQRAVRNLEECMGYDDLSQQRYGYQTCSGVSDSPAGFYFGDCCYVHDNCYWVKLCKKGKARDCEYKYDEEEWYDVRLECDEAFLNCMLGQCADQSWSERSRQHCEAMARKYYLGVRLLGGAFNYEGCGPKERKGGKYND